jgi:hypothetical protein
MKRFIITEEEKNSIRNMYGLINEQSVKIQGKQPAQGTDWDLVHGILGSKRLDDDLEYRVGEELKKGNYRVTKVGVTSKKVGNEIITDASVDLVPDNNKPHKIFTTRGSIGGDYVSRHDQQVNGLSDRLKTYYKGEVTVFGPYDIPVQGTNVKYKQTFFAVEGQPQSVQNQNNQNQNNQNQNNQNQNNQNKTGQVKYQVGKTYLGTRSTDKKDYRLTIKNVGPEGKYYVVDIQGPGLYDGKPMNRPGMELYPIPTGGLEGNMEMGKFQNLRLSN